MSLSEPTGKQQPINRGHNAFAVIWAICGFAFVGAFEGGVNPSSFGAGLSRDGTVVLILSLLPCFCLSVFRAFDLKNRLLSISEKVNGVAATLVLALFVALFFWIAL
jgi:hypothetical protein